LAYSRAITLKALRTVEPYFDAMAELSSVVCRGVAPRRMPASQALTGSTNRGSAPIRLARKTAGLGVGNISRPTELSDERRAILHHLGNGRWSVPIA
jgi:hypothetical protein